MKGWAGLVGWPAADGLTTQWSPVGCRPNVGQGHLQKFLTWVCTTDCRQTVLEHRTEVLVIFNLILQTIITAQDTVYRTGDYSTECAKSCSQKTTMLAGSCAVHNGVGVVQPGLYQRCTLMQCNIKKKQHHYNQTQIIPSQIMSTPIPTILNTSWWHSFTVSFG